MHYNDYYSFMQASLVKNLRFSFFFRMPLNQLKPSYLLFEPQLIKSVFTTST